LAWPYLSSTGFESGTRDHFDVETDTENRLDFPHYSTLAAIPGMAMPYRGAYCLRVQLANDGTPANALVQETGSADLAADATIFVRFAFWLSPDTVMANNDEFAIWQLWSSTNTVEAGVYINYTTANGFRIGIGETAATQLKPLTLGVWHQMEVGANIDAGGGNDGTLDGWLDGSAYTQITALDQGDITSSVVGVMSQDAGTTTGTLLIDEIVYDDTRIYPITDRFPTDVMLTHSNHVFVGSGCLENLSMLSGGGTDSIVEVYDTDTGYALDASNVKVELRNTAAGELVDPAAVPAHPFKRGCFIRITSTSGNNLPRALAKICWANNYSEGAMRTHALKRKPHPVLG
jgi:hypothetical protein